MPETVCIDNENGIILIDSSGLVGTWELSESLKAVLPIAIKQGFNKVLVDATELKLLPKFIYLHAFASDLARQTKGMRHAIIVSTHTPKDIKYIETVAIDHGAIVRICSSRDNAISWLNNITPTLILTNPSSTSS